MLRRSSRLLSASAGQGIYTSLAAALRAPHLVKVGCHFIHMAPSIYAITGQLQEHSQETGEGLCEVTEHALQELNLASSSDLVCTNIICEKVGDPCICRLSHALERLKDVVSLNLSGNRLTALPASIGSLKHLEVLNASNNDLRELPPTMSDLRSLQTLDISGNPIASRLPALDPQTHVVK